MVENTLLLRISPNEELDIRSIGEKLKSLEGKVSSLESNEVRYSLRETEAGYDILYSARFHTIEAFEEYQDDPYHRSVAEEISPLIMDSASICFMV